MLPLFLDNFLVKKGSGKYWNSNVKSLKYFVIYFLMYKSY